MRTDFPLLPGLTEVVEPPVTDAVWKAQDRTEATPIASMTTIHLMHCTAWMERHAEGVRRFEENRMLSFMLLHSSEMSEATEWHFDAELERLEIIDATEWLETYEPYAAMVEELEYRFGLSLVPKREVVVTNEELGRLLDLGGLRQRIVIDWAETDWDTPVLDLTQNEWAIRPLAIMRGLASRMGYKEMIDWARTAA